MNLIFSKCGYNRHTKRAILYGPKSLGGARFYHLLTLQGMGQLFGFLKHWRAPNTQPGTLVRIALAWTQLNAGTGTSILTDVQTPLPHCESKWFKALRSFLHSIDVSLELDDSYVLPLQRENDFYLMDRIITEGTFTDSQLTLINYCRLYLQAITLSDITTLNGSRLDKHKLKGKWSSYSSTSTIHKVVQQRPNESAWSQWRKACKMFTTNGKLHTPLGRWIVPESTSRTQWPAYYSSREDQFYIRTHSHFLCYYLNYDNSIDSSSSDTTSTLPNDSVPVDYQEHPNSIRMLSLTVRHIPISAAPVIPNFLDFLDALSPWEKELFHTVDMRCDIYEVMELLRQCNFRAASNGSVHKNQSAAFGWVLSVNGHRLVYCSGPVYGYKPTSYRAEGYGLLSFLRFLLKAIEFTGSTVQGGLSGCDNISLVNNVTNTENPPDDPLSHFGFDDSIDPDTLLSAANFSNQTMVSDWDVLTMLTDTIDKLPFPLDITHIKGHQDEDIPYKDLPYMAQLNVDADKLADRFQLKYGIPRPTVLRFPINQVQVNLRGINTITYKLKQVLYYEASANELKEYIAERNTWSLPEMETIDWKAHASVIAKGCLPTTHIVKLVHDILPTNY